MTSRKKIKGKDRKAKQAKQEAEKIEKQRKVVRDRWQRLARGDLGERGIIPCEHGFIALIPDADNHPVCAFMDEYWGSDVTRISELLNNTYKKQPQVWENNSLRKQARDLLVSMGTNLLLTANEGQMLARDVALTIAVLESYDHTCDINSMIYKHEVGIKLRDLFTGCSRDELKFFRKRTTCKCLKKMHLEARKARPKLGMCHKRREQKERTLLMVCGRCGIDQYCSRQCQIADWHDHKFDCDWYIKAKK